MRPIPRFFLALVYACFAGCAGTTANDPPGASGDDAATSDSASTSSDADPGADIVDSAPTAAEDGNGEGASPKEAGTPKANDILVNPGIVGQTMDGFGAADTWTPGGALTTAEARLFFDPVQGIGLSILRIGIDVNATGLGAGVVSDVKLAASYGAIVWGAPWSPPAGDKDNDSVTNGGHLCAAAGMGNCTGNDYDAWAAALASFPAWLKRQTNVDLYGISAQNEPDFAAHYASCLYGGQQMVDFVKVLGPKLAALSPRVKLLAAEPDNWSHLWSGSDDFGDAILNDPAAAAVVDILATHDYGFDPVAPPAGVSKPIWETEVSGVSGSAQAGPSVDIDNGIAVAQWVHRAIVTGRARAWHYWWLVSQASNNDNEGLLFPAGQGPNGVGDVNSPPKRLFAVGQFSKFVRPGYQRIDVSGQLPPGVQASAFQGPVDATVVIVAINSNTAPTQVQLFVGGTAWPSAVTPWVTSAGDNLAARSPIALAAARFSATLDPRSITTFVGMP